MAVSKVILNGNVLMDVTQDTVTAETLMQGETATGADGAKVTGTATGGGSTPKTFSVTLSNPKHTGEANYPPCVVYGCSDLYNLGSPIGQFDSTAGTVTVTTSEPLVALKFSSASMVDVGQYSLCEGCHPIDISFTGEEIAAFYVFEDGSATVSNVDYDG